MNALGQWAGKFSHISSMWLKISLFLHSVTHSYHQRTLNILFCYYIVINLLLSLLLFAIIIIIIIYYYLLLLLFTIIIIYYNFFNFFII